MAAIHWLNPLSGTFTNASDWAGGVVPGKSDDAILDPAGVSFAVTSATGSRRTAWPWRCAAAHREGRSVRAEARSRPKNGRSARG